jgi:hypothetical protein
MSGNNAINEPPEPERLQQYLSIKNWQRFQPRLKSGKPCRDWIRLDTHLEDDSEFIKLSCLERYVLIGVWRLKGRTGRNPVNDPTYISRALQVDPKTRPHIPHALLTVISRGFLIPCNQQIEEEFATRDETRQDETVRDKGQKPAPKEPAPVVRKPDAFVLPDWVPVEEWSGYLEMRTKIRKPMTGRAMRMAVKMLVALKEQGHEPAAVLNQSIFKSWQSLWPVAKEGNGNGFVNKAEQRSIDNMRALEGALRSAAERDRGKANSSGSDHGGGSDTEAT